MFKARCIDREVFYKEIKDYIIKSKSSSLLFIGKKGTGKEYVIKKIEDALTKECILYRVISDTLWRKKKKASTHILDISFSLNALIGFSLSIKKNDMLKLNYIISNLKTITHKKKILISAIDYETLSAEGREFIDIILYNKKFIEEKINKDITVIVTSSFDCFNGKYNIKNVFFEDYNCEDISHFLIDVCNYDFLKITENKLNQIHKLCGTNFDLIKNYAKIIIDMPSEVNSLDIIINNKLNYFIQSGYKYNLSRDSLKEILFACSMSLNLLTPDMIQYVIEQKLLEVQNGFSCAVEQYFLEIKDMYDAKQYTNYSFISESEKDHLKSIAPKTYSERMLKYYFYLSDNLEDEYFERSQYLMRYYGNMNKDVFALLILAISKSYLSNDNLERQNIITFFYEHNQVDTYQYLFEKIVMAYNYFYKCKYEETINILLQIDYVDINRVLAAELRRLEFKSGYLGHRFLPQRMNGLVQELQAQIEQELTIIPEKISKYKEEKILTLRIIYEIAPYILDAQNDKDNFLKLYDKSLLLVKYIQCNFLNKGFSEFVINIFNRKAFLYAAPSTASIYYEQAVGYFKENKIWDEYAISLASKAGNEIALHRYEKAINSCRQALTTLKEHEIEIEQKEKVYNNLYIAEFLFYEAQEEKQLYDIQNKALSIIRKLEKLLTLSPCGMNHVIMTNMASLYLYSDRIKEYYQTKKRLEISMCCKDISNLDDIKINDFYRYHFGWYEFYVFLKKGDWKKCKKILNKLNNFYPAIFHNEDKMNLRLEAANYLLKNKIIPDLRQYAFNILQYAPSDKGIYISRGLLLSDLQFTSWE